MRLARYFFFNWLFSVALWLAIVDRMEGAQNVIAFWTWLGFVASLAAFNGDFAKSMAEKGRVVPLWLDGSFDIVVVAVMAWNGWWWTAIAYTLCALFINHGYTEGQKKLDAAAA